MLSEQERVAYREMLEKEFEKQMSELLFNTPVYLASTSKVRVDAVKKFGFKEENIRTVSVPDGVELFALEDYLEYFTPSMADRHGTVTVEAVAHAKADFLKEAGVPEDALWLAFDTMPIIYQNKDYRVGNDKLISGMDWKGKSDMKPKNIEEAKKLAKNNFLTIIKNHLFFLKNLELSGYKTKKSEVFDRMDFASAIHIKTACAIKFPHEQEISVQADRIILRPQVLYDLAKVIDVNFDENISLEELYEIEIAEGQTIGNVVRELVEQIFEVMKEKGVDPTKIAGGIVYQLPEVRALLEAKERPNIISDYEEADQSIYTGFPNKLFESVIVRKIERMARYKVEDSFFSKK